jgi:hypothetical protein
MQLALGAWERRRNLTNRKKSKDGISAENVFRSFHFFFDTLPVNKT